MGPSAASEPETRAISRAVMDRRNQIKGFITVHAYAQLWLTRWSYTNITVHDHDEQVGNDSGLFIIFTVSVSVKEKQI